MLNHAYKIFVKKYISIKYLKNENCEIPIDEMIRRIHNQQKRMPDYLGFGIQFVALMFLCKSFFEAYGLTYQVHYKMIGWKFQTTKMVKIKYLVRRNQKEK